MVLAVVGLYDGTNDVDEYEKRRILKVLRSDWRRYMYAMLVKINQEIPASLSL